LFQQAALDLHTRKAHDVCFQVFGYSGVVATRMTSSVIAI
jgi:hypothetical protein